MISAFENPPNPLFRGENDIPPEKFEITEFPLKRGLGGFFNGVMKCYLNSNEK
jgi:hypothetical protein